jgi:hypothetical protein
MEVDERFDKEDESEKDSDDSDSSDDDDTSESVFDQAKQWLEDGTLDRLEVKVIDIV